MWSVPLASHLDIICPPQAFCSAGGYTWMDRATEDALIAAAPTTAGIACWGDMEDEWPQQVVVAAGTPGAVEELPTATTQVRHFAGPLQPCGSRCSLHLSRHCWYSHLCCSGCCQCSEDGSKTAQKDVTKTGQQN